MGKDQNRPKDLKLAYRVSYLLAAYIKGTLTEAEKQELEVWKNKDGHNRKLFAELTDENNLRESLADFDKKDPESYLEKSKQQLSFLRNRRTARLWWYAAACIAVILFSVLYFKPFSTKADPGIIADNGIDIPPGFNQATLTLENGKQVLLGDVQSDTVINGIATLHIQDGELSYALIANPNPDYHTLTIPRKGFYKLKLPDGTLVYLNAASSIRYPTAFTGTERRVTVTGETYFEVAKDKTKPFRVEDAGMVIEALGTAFNVNSYPDEPVGSTTLIEGSVQVSGAAVPVILQPGQQAQFSNGQLNVVVANTTEITAWKENRFVFSNSPVAVIMRQLARWYDVEIVYKENVSTELNATIERGVPLSRILELLSKTNDVHFKIEGNKIIVMK